MEKKETCGSWTHQTNSHLQNAHIKRFAWPMLLVRQKEVMNSFNLKRIKLSILLGHPALLIWNRRWLNKIVFPKHIPSTNKDDWFVTTKFLFPNAVSWLYILNLLIRGLIMWVPQCPMIQLQAYSYQGEMCTNTPIS